jgi:diguanylate cyclase (GGDEF)-like protein
VSGISSAVAAIALLSIFELMPGQHPMALASYFCVVGPVAAVTVGLAATPRQLFTKQRGYYLRGAWALANIGLDGLLVAVSGGGRSQLYLVYVLTAVFIASSFRRRTQIVLQLLLAISYASALTATGWHVSGPDLAARAVTIGLVAIMSSSIATDKDRNAAESARRASLLATVTDVSRDFNVHETDKVLDAVTAAVAQLGLEWGHVSLIDEETGTYRLVHAQGVPTECVEAKPSVAAGIVGMVREEKRTVFLSKAPAKDYVTPALGRDHELASVVATPLWVDGALDGVLCGASRQARTLGPEDIEAFELLAGVASRALEAARRSQEMTANEAFIKYQASHDELTGLANRGLLNARLHQALTWTGGPERVIALFVVDLDDFKLVNDSLGHSVGDQILVTIGSRLMSCVRETDTVARLSGDEFAILVRGIDRGALTRLAQRLLEAVRETTVVWGRSVSVATSIGSASRPAVALNEDVLEATAGELLGNADVAMHEAKRAGKGCHVAFDPTMRDRMDQRLAIEADLPHAIEAGQMTVYYQPIFDLATYDITGFEALLRWSHPVLGSVPPSEFIPIAEETGAIVAIGSWVLRQACCELQALRTENTAWAGMTMSVNLSTRQLRHPDLVEEVVVTLKATGVPPAQLTLEITESSLLQDAASSQAKLATLSAMGVQVALDDFGTGYSSLAYLQQLKVHSLKIDKCFVDGTDVASTDRTAPALIHSIAKLGEDLGLSTVAEGVETRDQLSELRRLGCNRGQGYVFSPAVPPDKLRALLTSGGPLREGQGWPATEDPAMAGLAAASPMASTTDT